MSNALLDFATNGGFLNLIDNVFYNPVTLPETGEWSGIAYVGTKSQNCCPTHQQVQNEGLSPTDSQKHRGTCCNVRLLGPDLELPNQNLSGVTKLGEDYDHWAAFVLEIALCWVEGQPP
jgi:hypothetical protein